MEPKTGAVNTTGEAVALSLRLTRRILQGLRSVACCAIGRALPVGLLLFVFRGRRDVLPFVVVDITTDFEVEVSLGRWSRRSSAIGRWMRFPLCDSMVGPRLEGLEAPWCIGDDAEVACEGRTDV